MAEKREDVIGKVQHALALAPQLDAPKITITMLSDTELALGGIVDNDAQRTKAEEVVRKAAPGLAIENGLTVGANRQKISDSDLQAKALEAVDRARGQIKTRPVSVSTEIINGLVHLRGTCSTAADRQFLIEAIATMPGIGGVVADDFEVAPFGSADDIRLGNLAIERLQGVSQALAGAVGVDVRNRSAHLMGTVRNDHEKSLAEKVVMQVPGIKRVYNELTCSQAGERSSGDHQLQQQVIHALAQAGLPMPNIHVYAIRDMITLDGEVESVEQKRDAERLARRCRGVHQVDNRLKVNLRRGDVPLPESGMR